MMMNLERHRELDNADILVQRCALHVFGALSKCQAWQLLE